MKNFFVGVMLSVCTFASVESSAQEASVGKVRIVKGGLQEIYLKPTQRCRDAILKSAEIFGLEDVTHLDPDTSERSTDAIDFFITPNAVDFFPGSRPIYLYYMQEEAAFADVAHFARFMDSDLLKQLIADQDQLLTEPLKLIALAYGGTSQIATSDRPVMTPEDLRGRTQIGLYNAWWYAEIYEEMGIGHDPTLGWHVETNEEYRAAATAAAKKRKSSKRFFVMPPETMLDVLEPSLRKYIALTMTHVQVIDINVWNWYGLDEATQAVARQIAEDAGRACSASNFEHERAALEILKSEGSQVFPVDVEAFLGLAVLAAEKKQEDEAPDRRDSRLKLFRDIMNLR